MRLLRIGGISVADLVALASSVFFPLFFVPLVNAGSFSLDLNFVAALLLCLFIMLRPMKGVFLNGYCIVTFFCWVGVLVGYLAAVLVLGERPSFWAYIAQLIYLFSALGLGAVIYDWMKNVQKRRYLLWYINLSILSFGVSMLVYCPLEKVIGFWSGVFRLDPFEAIQSSRQAFYPGLFLNGVSLQQITNYHNRIAQHFFSFSFFVVSVVFLLRRCSGVRDVTFYIILSVSSVVAFSSLVLLSGQVLAQMLLSAFFVGFAIVFFEPKPKMVGLLLLSAFFFIGAGLAISSTDVAQSWLGRLGSDDISTGRVDRWLYYYSLGSELSVFGLINVPEIDPHNMFVTVFFHAGVFSFAFYVIYYFVTLYYAFSDSRKGYRAYGVTFLLLMSVGVQICFVMLIAGGYGFPGWSEMSKMSLFFAAILMVSNKVEF